MRKRTQGLTQRCASAAIPGEPGWPGLRPSPRQGLLHALLLVLAVSSLPGCALVTWGFGESRGAGTTAPAPAPASPLGASTAASAPAPSAEGRADTDLGTSGTSGAVATNEPSAANRPAASSVAAATSPVPSGSSSSPGPVGSTGSAPPSSRPPAPPLATAGSPPPAPARATAAAPTKPTPASGRYVVQVGAFRSALSAESVRDQLAGELGRAPELAGLLGSLRVATQGGLHRVWLGGADTAADAGALAARIRAATGRDTFVMRP